MSNQKEYFKGHLETLHINCFQGILHIKVWEDLNEELKRRDDLYKKFNFFWLTTLKAQLEAAQLHLLKLFDKPKDSITIDRLVKFAEDNKEKLFNPEDLDRVELEINAYRSEIIEFESIKSELIDIRNNHFIHLSKKYAGDYDKLYENYSKMRGNIHEILLVCGEILNSFKELVSNEFKMMILGTEVQTKKLINALSKS